jgi:predicted RNase H-like HicB family nuclease
MPVSIGWFGGVGTQTGRQQFRYPLRMKLMKRTFNATTWQEGEWFIAQCIEVDVASQGESQEEALKNLREALELHFTPPVATSAPQVHAVEVEITA